MPAEQIKAQMNALELAIPAGVSSAELEELYERSIHETKCNGLTLYKYEREDGSIGYAIPFEGRLVGSIG